MRQRRTIWLWAFVLWTLALGILSVGRGVGLWRERMSLRDLGSSLSPVILTLFVSLDLLCGGGIIAAAVGLWWRCEWARQAARVLIPFYMVLVQAYVWFFLRAGLMWERRWVMLLWAVLATALALTALTWHRSRYWLGLVSDRH